MNKIITIVLLICANLLIADDIGYVDVHLHLGGPPMRFGPNNNKTFSRGDWRGYTDSEYLSAAKKLLVLMDKYGVAKAILMPPPQVPEQKRHDNYRPFLKITQKYPNRLYLLAGGRELNTLIHKYPKNKVTRAIKTLFRKKAENLVKLGIKGFGEMAVLHLSFNPKHVYEEVQPDHPLFLLLADIAAKYDLPIDIHMEAVPQDMKLPAGFSRVSFKNPSILKANIPGFERLLAHNRKAKIVWQHIGWDNTGNMTVALLRNLLKKHSNLHMALRIEERLFDMAGKPMPNRIVDRNWRVQKEWMLLFMDFSERFVIGTDEFIGVPWVSRRMPQSFEETWCIIKQLPLHLRTKIGRSNAMTIYNLD